MTRVINVRGHNRLLQEAEAAGTYVFIGRPSKWGNPFPIYRNNPSNIGARWDAVHAFRDWWYAHEQDQLRADALVELQDKVLGCYCHPLPCHGHVIAEFVNNPHAERAPTPHCS